MYMGIEYSSEDDGKGQEEQSLISWMISGSLSTLNSTEHLDVVEQDWIFEWERDSPKVNVWMGVTKSKVYGPYMFAERTVTETFLKGGLPL
ncbi:hypothetical protein C0J52_22526 [Blattella germanica]|nr:hypothetical protein C0J52_22526 [Blattella germanica]